MLGRVIGRFFASRGIEVTVGVVRSVFDQFRMLHDFCESPQIGPIDAYGSSIQTLPLA